MFPKFPGAGADDAAAVIEQVRQLAGHLARPTAAGRDRHREWDETLFKALTVPGTFGGGLTAVQTSALLTALGEGSQDPGLALAVTTHAVLVTVPLRTFGTDAQRERYLAPIAAGEWLGGLSLLQTSGGPKTVTARAAGPDWALSGTLDLVALGPKAHHFLVIASHSTGARTAFLIDADTPGLEVVEAAPAALRTCPWGRLVLDNCVVPAEAVLGSVGGAATEVEPLLATLDWIFVSAAWLGILRALATGSLAAARTRELLDSQSARFTLADLNIQNELVAGLLTQVAAGLDESTPTAYQDAASARLFTASAVRAVTEAAAELAGLEGSDLVDRAYRDARFFVSSGGGSEVLRPVIAASILEDRS